jgi:hypothetical protein
MKVTVRKSGGIAGVHEQIGPVDTAQEGDAGGRIEAKIEQIGFFSMPKELPEEHRIIDGFGYGVSVDDGDRHHEVEYGDGTKREERQPLDELQGLLEENGWTYRDVPREAEPAA